MGQPAGGIVTALGTDGLATRSFSSILTDYVALLKPRVMSLVVFTGGVGIAAAPGTADLATVLSTLLFMALGAGACGALNMWYDADIDAIMRRTQTRPIPRGVVPPSHALAIGTFLSLGSVAALGVTVNWLAAFLLAFTIVFYVFVYTMVLKRRTPQNIVIGGASGALPPMIGWTAATGDVGLGALALFLIIFLWTPPHFWALAIARSGDYAKAGVPMMPNVAGAASTANQIVVYSLLLVGSTALPVMAGSAGALYAVAAALLDAVLLWRALVLWRAVHADGGAIGPAAIRLFGYSIVYLFALFGALLVGAQ